MRRPGLARKRIAGILNSAYAGGLLTSETFDHRLDALLGSRLVEPSEFVGDLSFRASRRRLRQRWTTLRIALLRREAPSDAGATLLALDWSGGGELLVGRSSECDVVLVDPEVSRRHARLSFRDGRWIVQDLASTNGTYINGVRVGRSELHPGDLIELARRPLVVD